MHEESRHLMATSLTQTWHYELLQPGAWAVTAYKLQYILRFDQFTLFKWRLAQIFTNFITNRQ